MSTPAEYEHKAVQSTLLSNYCPEPIQEARERQDEILIKRYRGGVHSYADLGCGDGYHGSIFAPGARAYHGFEISVEMAQMARQRWKKEKLDNAAIFEGDLSAATTEDEFYDLVFCLYFTPGNFRDRFEDLSLYTDANLDDNPAFQLIIRKFYRALKANGRMYLTIYKDVPEAAGCQMDFYQKTGQHVITDTNPRFIATREGFWSVRWTRESMLSNLKGCDISAGSVTFHGLNAIAWLVEIAK